jgi:hypothetical protein
MKKVRNSLLRVLERFCTWLEMKLYGENLPDVVDSNGELQEDNTYLMEKLKSIEALNESLETDVENLKDALNFLKR